MDSAGVRPFEEDRATFYEDLGVDIEDAFASIDPTPVASASLAQVYKATTPGGRDGRGQDPAEASGILATRPRHHRRVLLPAVLSHPGPEVPVARQRDPGGTWPRSWTFARKLRTRSARGVLMAKDFDGRRAARPEGARCAGRLEEVLTQEWCDGVRMNDKEGLHVGDEVDRRELATLVNRIFGRMAVLFPGFVHCDPHQEDYSSTPPARSRAPWDTACTGPLDDDATP